MSLSESQKQELKRLVELVDEKFRAEAASKIIHAMKHNWSKIAYWSSNGKYHPSDLIGLDQGGNFNYLVDPVIESSS